MEWHWVILGLVRSLLSVKGVYEANAHYHMLVLMENGLLEAHSAIGQLLF